MSGPMFIAGTEVIVPGRRDQWILFGNRQNPAMGQTSFPAIVQYSVVPSTSVCPCCNSGDDHQSLQGGRHAQRHRVRISYSVFVCVVTTVRILHVPGLSFTST